MTPPRFTPDPPPAAGKRLAPWPAARIRPDPANPRTRFPERSLDELAATLRAVGQQSPVIGYPDPAAPDWLVLVDGHRRLLAAPRVPLAVLDAVVLPARPSPAELRLVQLSLGTTQERLSPADLADAYAALMRELGITQAELAGRLGVSETKVSNAFAYHRLPPELRDRAAALEPSVVPLIARLAPADQPTVLAYAAEPTPAGKRPTRDEVTAFIAARRATARPGPKAQAFAGTVDGRAFRIALRPADTHESLAEFLKALAAVVLRHRTVPVPNLGVLVRG